jgi:hypothetical protein
MTLHATTTSADSTVAVSPPWWLRPTFVVAQTMAVESVALLQLANPRLQLLLLPLWHLDAAHAKQPQDTLSLSQRL